jgi:hypothetical protein
VPLIDEKLNGAASTETELAISCKAVDNSFWWWSGIELEDPWSLKKEILILIVCLKIKKIKKKLCEV